MVLSHRLKKSKLFSLITVLHVSLSYCMDQTAEQGLVGIEKLKDAQQVYERGIFEFLRLLGAKEALEYDPYACFRRVLASPGQEIRELRALSAYSLGLMCKAQLGVPNGEMGISGAKQYFLKAIYEGHVPSLNELARCEREAGNEAGAHELWRQENFLELCQSCVASKDASARDEQTVEQAAQAITLSEALTGASKQQPYYSPALNSLLSALKECAGRGQHKANCLLARLYVSMPDKSRDDIIQAMAPILSSCPDEQRMPLIDSAEARPALQVVADVGNVVACAQLGIALYNEKCYAESYHYCSKAAQQGDLKARCYCIIMEIMGLGKPKSLPGAAREIQELTKSEEGRQSLKFLTQFYDLVCAELTNAKSKLRKPAAFIHGVLLYHLHKDAACDVLAFKCLASCVSEFPYACYCCVDLLSRGRVAELPGEEVVCTLGKILTLNSLDEHVRAKCIEELKKIAATGNIAGMCEYCMACMHDSVPLEEFKGIVNHIFARPQLEHAPYRHYFQMEKSAQIIMKAKREGNVRAIFLFSVLQIVQADLSQEVDQKLPLFQEAYDNILLAHERGIANDKDLCYAVTCLAGVLHAKGRADEAKKYLESAVKYGSLEVKRLLATFIVEDKNATHDDIQKALGFFEESARQGNVDDQRLLAQIYKRDALFNVSNVWVKADVKKSYELVNMLLKSLPDDVEGCYVLGYLLANHGGSDGIPAGQHARAYELLLFALAQKKDVLTKEALADDYYLLGRVCFANENFEQAIKWFDSAGDVPQGICCRGLAMLCEVERGSKLYDRDTALAHIEKSLSFARKFLVAKQIGYSELFCNELLIKILTEEAGRGDHRARTMLARIACFFDDGVVGISKERAFGYLVEAADAGVASAQSFLGFMALHGTTAVQSEAAAFEYLTKACQHKDLPDYIQDEIAEELLYMGREALTGPLRVKAACYGIIALLRDEKNVNRALELFEKIETDCKNIFMGDKDLTSFIYRSGAWESLKQLAMRRRAGDMLVALGVPVVSRFIRGDVDFQFVKTEALPLLELGLQCGTNLIDKRVLSTQYLACVKHAMEKKECDFNAFRLMLERAQEHDPQNKDVSYLSANIYIQHAFPDDADRALVKKGWDILQSLADSNHSAAALDMGLSCLANARLGTIMASFKNGVKYLNIAARTGSNYALSLLVGMFLREKAHNAQYVKTVLQGTMRFLLNQPVKDAEERVFLQAMANLMAKRNAQAVKDIEQLNQNTKGAGLCIVACEAILCCKQGLQNGGDLLLKALDIIGANRISIEQIGLTVVLQNILQDLEARAGSDSAVAGYMARLKATLARYNYAVQAAQRA